MFLTNRHVPLLSTAKKQSEGITQSLYIPVVPGHWLLTELFPVGYNTSQCLPLLDAGILDYAAVKGPIFMPRGVMH